MPAVSFVAHRRLLAAFLAGLAVVSTNAAAQGGVIHGRVFEAPAAQPLQGVLVSVLGTARAAATDADGSFSFAGVTPGRYEVEARIAGGTMSLQQAFVRGGDSVAVTFTLARSVVSLVGVEVVGAPADALDRLPGSVSVVTAGELRLRQPLSGGEVLRSLAGVHVQEEEGAGLRANVGIRGLDPDRSRTLLVLEDGVPVALAPYGEPELYYTPPIDRMERLELVKGSGSILFGPQTIGGVLNFVTAEPPARASGSALLQVGSHGVRVARIGYGGAWRDLRGSIGVLERGARDVMGLHYDVRDVTAKLGTTTPVGDFGFKASVYDESSNATYVGLTEGMYRSDPRQHPAPDDRLRIRRQALTASHEMVFGAASRVRTNLYAYHTVRNWRRQDYGFTADSSAHVFTGTTGNRNREFHVIGLEPRLRTTWITGGIASEFEAGIRVHYERARDQHINGLSPTASDGELRDDEVRHGRALAMFAQNRFFVTDKLYVTPGIRLERFSYDRNILRTRVRRQAPEGGSRAPEDVGLGGGDGLTELIPGIGAAWTPSGRLSIFAGAHRGFAPPRVKDALVYADPRLGPGDQVPQLQTLHLDAERSVNFELGARLAPLPYLSLEATGFLLDFTNQIITPSLSAGAVADVQLANQGATRHRGTEATVMLDIGKALERPFGLVARVAATQLNAVFSRDRFMRRGSDTVNVKGNRLPYAPRFMSSGSLTFMGGNGIELRTEVTYVGEQFADNFETRAASLTGLVGVIPAYTAWGASGRAPLPLMESATVTWSVKNLFGATYVASRRPEGIKPGSPRTAFVGLNVTF
ncbi:TonB-dependent receptor family protein [soil metagenome]